MAHLQGPVESDPLAELPVKNAESIRNCTEMYLSGRGIEVLAGFERFVNIEVLWINNNRVCGPVTLWEQVSHPTLQLLEIENLDQCIRIKELYAHNNRIEYVRVSATHERVMKCVCCFQYLGRLFVGVPVLTHPPFGKQSSRQP